MAKSTKSRSEEMFTASQKKDERDLMEKAKARQARTDKSARLKALRLGKQAFDLKAMEIKAAEDLAKKNKAPRPNS